MIRVKMLPAQQGDCIILKYGSDDKAQSMIIIDGGMGKECTRKLQIEITDWVTNQEKAVDLLVLTHYDFDHISGFVNLFQTDVITNDSIHKIWFNFGQALSNAVKENAVFNIEIPDSSLATKVNQGVDLHKAICQKKINLSSYIAAGMQYELNGAKITIVSPSIFQLKELINNGGKLITYDSTDLQTANTVAGKDVNLAVEEAAKVKYSENSVSPENKSSIAFVFEYENKKLLFCGDAVSSQIETELRKMGYSNENRLKVDACKIMHHGSQHNTNGDLIQVIDCHKYLISGKWGKERPSKTCLSRIIINSIKPVEFYCNYPVGEMFTEEEKAKYNITISNIGESELIF